MAKELSKTQVMKWEEIGHSCDLDRSSSVKEHYYRGGRKVMHTERNMGRTPSLEWDSGAVSSESSLKWSQHLGVLQDSPTPKSSDVHGVSGVLGSSFSPFPHSRKSLWVWSRFQLVDKVTDPSALSLSLKGHLESPHSSAVPFSSFQYSSTPIQIF
jgi:hypothetical protein